MKNRHPLVIALLIGAAAIAGLVAVTRTANLGRSAQRAVLSTARVDARNRQLDQARARLHRLLAQQPARKAVGSAAKQKVVYVRPAPRVVTIHRSHGDDATEGDERRGEFDD